MAYHVALNRMLSERITELIANPPPGGIVKDFWKELASALNVLASNPVGRGEILYGYKRVSLQEYVVVIGHVAVQYAVNDENHSVIITRLGLSGDHPYPSEIEEALNPRLA